MIMQVITKIYTSPKRSKRLRNRFNRKVRRAIAMSVYVSQEISDGDNSVYIVTDRHRHIVTITPNGLADCSCGNANSPCAHVISVRIFRHESIFHLKGKPRNGKDNGGQM